jgi:C-terminal processing protease CtpA/Prc
LSVYDYRSPKGSRVEGRGVTPDIVVPVPETPTADENDPVVRAAIEALSSAASSPAAK